MPNPARGHLWTLCVLLLAALCPLAPAQVDLLRGGDPTQPAGAGGEVGLVVETVGFSNAARPGEWCGVRVRVTDRGDRQREVIVRASIPDADGDTAQYETVVTTNPGIEQPVWLYLRLPYDIEEIGFIRLQAFEAVETDDGADFTEGRMLGQVFDRWRGLNNAASAFIGVVGTEPPGLTGYKGAGRSSLNETVSGSRIVQNPLGHEMSQIVSSRPDALPDRWLGLYMLRELVWNNASPNELRIEQVRALREWIERGGHLVVILPAIGQDWLALGNRELDALLPRVVVDRQESLPLNQFRNLLTDSPTGEEGVNIPDTDVATASFLTPRADAAPGEADVILADAEGRGLVVARTVGLGQVTLIGMPVNLGRFRQLGLPEVDVFWHRVLGRRGKWATGPEMQEIERTQGIGGSNRSALNFDQDIVSFIGKTGRSLAGVMLGLVVFITYWVVAGPGGFALLKGRGQTRHSWIGFFAASLVFTAIAWGGATVLRPKRVELSHLSYLDHVYGQRVQRVRSWASVLVPVYGNATVGLESDDAASGSAFVQAVAPWESNQSSIGASRGAFPDARDYRVNSREPDALTFPARATVKHLQFDWAGGMAWDSIRPVTSGEQDPMTALRPARPGSGSLLEGSIVHGFPVALDDAHLIVFGRQIDVRPGINTADMLSIAPRAISLGTWEPGVPIDLADATPSAVASSNMLSEQLRRFISRGDNLSNRIQSVSDEHLVWLTFFNLLPPPEYRGAGSGFSTPTLAQRTATHALDMSRWSTRPCVMVIGVLRQAGEGEAPAPVWVETNGQPRTVQASGTTIVRWVYPLPPSPPDVDPYPLPEPAPLPG